MMKHFTIDEADWAKLMDLSREARNTPVIALSVADGLAGRDFASLARQRVLAYWKVLGAKYGFDPSRGVQPVDEARRIVGALALPTR